MDKNFDKDIEQLLKTEGVVKKGDALWFKKKFFAPPGMLYLTPKRIVFEKSGNQFAGVLLKLLMRSQRSHFLHNIELSSIKELRRDTFGLNKNILTLVLFDGTAFSFNTNGFDEWKATIEKQTLK